MIVGHAIGGGGGGVLLPGWNDLLNSYHVLQKVKFNVSLPPTPTAVEGLYISCSLHDPNTFLHVNHFGNLLVFSHILSGNSRDKYFDFASKPLPLTPPLFTPLYTIMTGDQRSTTTITQREAYANQITAFAKLMEIREQFQIKSSQSGGLYFEKQECFN